MSNKKDLKAFVRFDGSGRIVPGSLILRRKKPKVGNWVEISAYECCDPFTSSTTTSTTTAGGPTTTTTTTPPPTTTSTTTPVPPPINVSVENFYAAAPPSGTTINWNLPVSVFNDAGQQPTVTVTATADCGVLWSINASAAQLEMEFNLYANGVLVQTLNGGVNTNGRVNVLAGQTVSFVTVIPPFFTLNIGAVSGSFSTTLIP